MADSHNNKKFVVAGMASILLVAAVVDAVVDTTESSGPTKSPTGGINKLLQGMCSPTLYKDTCENILSKANPADPKELIKVFFKAAVENVADVIKNSPLLKEAAANPKTKGVAEVCQEVLGNVVDDLNRSIENIELPKAGRPKEYLEDVKTWLSAVIANQETCIDAFVQTSPETGEKMKKALGLARQLSSNGLAMVTKLSNSVLTDYGGRKLLHAKSVKRRLIEAARIEVAKDGSGKFKTIGEAIASLPKKNNDSIMIHVKAGVYNEQVKIPKKVNNILLVGEGPKKTRITGGKSFAKGVTTYHSATVSVDSENFLAKDIGIENTAGPQGEQAVALRVSGDKAIFYNVALAGYQDTLYAHTYRQYYRDCSISGTIDFVFGHSLSLFQNCKFIVRKPGPNQACMVTADGRVDRNSIGGLIIQNGDITAEPEFIAAKPPHKAFLGRPWKELSTTIIMQSNIEGFIDPTGWSPWQGTFALDTCYYAEYDNRGTGSNTTGRVKWKGIKKLTHGQAEKWTGGVVYKGDEWIKKSGIPYVPTMMKL